jgi:hypothetical protein
MFGTVAGVGLAAVVVMDRVRPAIGSVGLRRRAIDDRLQEAVENVRDPAGIFGKPIG